LVKGGAASCVFGVVFSGLTLAQKRADRMVLKIFSDAAAASPHRQNALPSALIVN